LAITGNLFRPEKVRSRRLKAPLCRSLSCLPTEWRFMIPLGKLQPFYVGWNENEQRKYKY
jgi:hypothetical protein